MRLHLQPSIIASVPSIYCLAWALAANFPFRFAKQQLVNSVTKNERHLRKTSESLFSVAMFITLVTEPPRPKSVTLRCHFESGYRRFFLLFCLIASRSRWLPVNPSAGAPSPRPRLPPWCPTPPLLPAIVAAEEEERMWDNARKEEEGIDKEDSVPPEKPISFRPSWPLTLSSQHLV